MVGALIFTKGHRQGLHATYGSDGADHQLDALMDEDNGEALLCGNPNLCEKALRPDKAGQPLPFVGESAS